MSRGGSLDSSRAQQGGNAGGRGTPAWPLCWSSCRCLSTEAGRGIVEMGMGQGHWMRGHGEADTPGHAGGGMRQNAGQVMRKAKRGRTRGRGGNRGGWKALAGVARLESYADYGRPGRYSLAVDAYMRCYPGGPARADT